MIISFHMLESLQWTASCLHLNRFPILVQKWFLDKFPVVEILYTVSISIHWNIQWMHICELYKYISRKQSSQNKALGLSLAAKIICKSPNLLLSVVSFHFYYSWALFHIFTDQCISFCKLPICLCLL